MMTEAEVNERYRSQGKGIQPPPIWYMSKCSNCIPTWFHPYEGTRHFTQNGECYKINYRQNSLYLHELFDTEEDLVREYQEGARMIP